MTLKRIILLCSLVALSLSGCEKDSETSPSTTQIQKLTAFPWRITSWTQTENGGSAVDQFTRNCDRDDRYSFGTNGVLTQNEGPQACSGGTPQGIVSTRPWDFNSAQTILTIGSASMGNGAVPWDVVQLTADVMQLRYTRTSGGKVLVDTKNYAN